MKLKLLALSVLIVCVLSAQHGGTPVQQVNYPYDSPTTIIAYDGSNNAIFIGYASAKQPAFTWTRTASTLTSIVVATNVGTVTTSTAHGLAVGNPVIVTGTTGDPDLNATYRIATVGSSTTFTITTVSVSDGTYNNAAMVLSTTAPRTTAAIWSISCLNYTGTNMTSKGWVGGLPASFTQIWANRATLACQ